jgi:ABC-type polar amino acid transport system ATPase subunit
MQSLSGQSFIGFARSQSTGPVQRCVNPATATELPTDFFQATPADLEQACLLAQAAAPVLAGLSGGQKAEFLRTIAIRIEAAIPDLVARATQETALPEARCQGEISRTISRLKEAGFTILLVEQNFRFAATVADRYYVMEGGKVIDEIDNAHLEQHVDKLNEYLGV